MTGQEVKRAIIEEMKDFKKHHPDKTPEHVTLPWQMAYELMKLGEDDLPGLASELLRDGVAAFERHTLFGLKVVVTYEPHDLTVN